MNTLGKLLEKTLVLTEETTVFGEGSENADIILVGEAPGANEVEQKRPFVGKAGKNLDHFLDVLEMKREEIYITNVVKKRPYKINEKTKRKSNRPPTKEEVKTYLPILEEEINIIKPKIIVTLGNFALKAITKDPKITIGQVHGQIINEEKYKIYPLYHPASIIYNRQLKDVYENDLKHLKEIID